VKYRSEIDGLRALAVIPVILFHAGFELFDGGFVGVDIFFVISGYLITTILIEDIENNKLSLANFYERRARRIFPALFFVMFVTILLFTTFLPPTELRDFFQSIFAVSLFSSNFLFWMESGYFDSEAADKPLLHTWSIAVEEQYYLLFPIFLILAWRFGKNRVFWMIIIMAAISLLLSEWGWRNKPVANFYLAPTRAWELLSGSIASFILHNKVLQKNNFLTFFGLFLIVFSIFNYDEKTPFPSLYSLAPVAGTLLIILFADKNLLVTRILSSKPIVTIGLISYSAYLWHHPILVFTNLYFFNGITDIMLIAIVIGVFVLAYFSWKYIENPFRKNVLNRKQFFLISFTIILAFLTLSISYQLNILKLKTTDYYWGNHVHELPKKFTGIKIDGVNCSSRDPFSSCVIGKNSTNQVVIIGDSHARTLTEPAFELASQDRLSFVDMTASSCPFLLKVNIFLNGILKEECSESLQERRLDYLRELEPSLILMHSRFSYYLHDSPFDNTIGGVEPTPSSKSYGIKGDESFEERRKIFSNSLRNTVNELDSIGHSVVIISPVPTNGWHPAKRLLGIMNKYGRNETLEIQDVRSLMSIPKDAVNKRQSDIQIIINEIAEDFDNVSVFNSLNIFCDMNRCHAISENGNILYADRHHLSSDGASYLLSAVLSEAFGVEN
jgi:peptidoglycan/LPS O-acetylase OafA/YrhL